MVDASTAKRLFFYLHDQTYNHINSSKISVTDVELDRFGNNTPPLYIVNQENLKSLTSLSLRSATSLQRGHLPLLILFLFGQLKIFKILISPSWISAVKSRGWVFKLPTIIQTFSMLKFPISFSFIIHSLRVNDCLNLR